MPHHIINMADNIPEFLTLFKDSRHLTYPLMLVTEILRDFHPLVEAGKELNQRQGGLPTEETQRRALNLLIAFKELSVNEFQKGLGVLIAYFKRYKYDTYQFDKGESPVYTRAQLIHSLHFFNMQYHKEDPELDIPLSLTVRAEHQQAHLDDDMTSNVVEAAYLVEEDLQPMYPAERQREVNHFMSWSRAVSAPTTSSSRQLLGDIFPRNLSEAEQKTSSPLRGYKP